MLQFVRHKFLTLLALLIATVSFSQENEVLDSLATKKNMQELQQEAKDLNFQKFFFKALEQKAIGNYDKAIEALEKCQNIRKEDLAVIFEFSKNYFAQEKFFEATALVKQALEKQPENTYFLQHLKNIYVKEKNYPEALEVQKKIVKLKPQFQADLIILYIRNNKIDEARNLLIELDAKGMVTESLEVFKESLFPKGKIAKSQVDEPKQLQKTLVQLKEAYANNKSFALLKQILNEQFVSNQFKDLQEESKKGIALYPAQPYVYLMHAKALNKLSKYNEAIPHLKSGLDYVIENNTLEADFYEELSLSYESIGNKAESNKYVKLATQKRNNKS